MRNTLRPGLYRGVQVLAGHRLELPPSDNSEQHESQFGHIRDQGCRSTSVVVRTSGHQAALELALVKVGKASPWWSTEPSRRFVSCLHQSSDHAASTRRRHGFPPLSHKAGKDRPRLQRSLARHGRNVRHLLPRSRPSWISTRKSSVPKTALATLGFNNTVHEEAPFLGSNLTTEETALWNNKRVARRRETRQGKRTNLRLGPQDEMECRHGRCVRTTSLRP